MGRHERDVGYGMEEKMFALIVGAALGAAGMYWYEHKDENKKGD